MDTTFEFDFDAKFMAPLVAFGATPMSSGVTLSDDGRLIARFGFTTMETEVSNITGIELSGPYRALKAIGIRLSLTDRGLTFGSNTREGVCIKFATPVTASPPWGTIKHPGLTLTLKDRDRFAAAITALLDERELAGDDVEEQDSRVDTGDDSE